MPKAEPMFVNVFYDDGRPWISFLHSSAEEARAEVDDDRQRCVRAVGAIFDDSGVEYGGVFELVKVPD